MESYHAWSMLTEGVVLYQPQYAISVRHNKAQAAIMNQEICCRSAFASVVSAEGLQLERVFLECNECDTSVDIPDEDEIFETSQGCRMNADVQES